MELYKLTAHLNNGTHSSFVFDYLPENFEGVKIAQKFSFVNPMGYTPKFSIDTMRIIASDKLAIDTSFLQYGLESDVTIDIQELNTNGTTYGTARTFAIDFESYEIFDEYSEFALKSVSVIDNYNRIKNTEVQFALNVASAELPTSQKLMNYVSLKSNGNFFSPYLYFTFIENNPSKFYTKDFSLYERYSGDDPSKNMYIVGENSSPLNVFLIISGSFNIKITGINENVQLQVVKISGITETVKVILFSRQVVSTGTIISYIIEPYAIHAGSCLKNDVFLLRLNTTNTAAVITGDVFVDFNRVTNIGIVNSPAPTILYKPISTLLSSFFESVSFPFSEDIFNFGITAANSLSGLSNYTNIKPKDFLSDVCALGGLICNFKIDGTVSMMNISNYFNDLFEISMGIKVNAVTIFDFKDVSIRHAIELNFASISVGQDIATYDTYTYFEDWNRILIFSQTARNASENIELTNTNLRSDFSGILDYFQKRSKQKNNPSKDNFIFNPTFLERNDAFSGTPNPAVLFPIYDYLTPRDAANNWKRFLACCFQNFGKNTLTISSNGGCTDNPQIGTGYLMDDFVLAETPRLLPIAYTFTALIDDIDFSEKILKINHDGEDVYIFVTNAETMDNFSEQTITGLKIQF